MDDGKNKQTLIMNSSHWGVRLGKMLWHNMKNFSRDCVVLVIADDRYKKRDCVKDYDEFLKMTRKGEFKKITKKI